MWDLQLQCFDGPSIDMKYFSGVKKVGRFSQLEHGEAKMREVLHEAENAGHKVIDSCYFTADGKQSFALLLVRQGVPLYGDVDY